MHPLSADTSTRTIRTTVNTPSLTHQHPRYGRPWGEGGREAVERKEVGGRRWEEKEKTRQQNKKMQVEKEEHEKGEKESKGVVVGGTRSWKGGSTGEEKDRGRRGGV